MRPPGPQEKRPQSGELFCSVAHAPCAGWQQPIDRLIDHLVTDAGAQAEHDPIIPGTGEYAKLHGARRAPRGISRIPSPAQGGWCGVVLILQPPNRRCVASTPYVFAISASVSPAYGPGLPAAESIQRIRPPSPVDKTERFCAARSVPTIVHTNRVRMEPKIPARRGAAPVTVRRPATHSSAGLSWSTVKDVLRGTERRLHHALETVAA